MGTPLGLWALNLEESLVAPFVAQFEEPLTTTSEVGRQAAVCTRHTQDDSFLTSCTPPQPRKSGFRADHSNGGGELGRRQALNVAPTGMTL